MASILSSLFDSKNNSKLTSKSAYDFSFTKLHSDEKLPLSLFKGKVLFIVNTASKCGLTGQYKELEELHQKYKDRGLIILGVPCNDFGGQEPGESEEIASFCQRNYGVSFTMANKEVVKGNNAHLFYKWAKAVLGFGTAPKWNFHKYIVDKNGGLADYFNSPTSPMASRVQDKIEELLNA